MKPFSLDEYLKNPSKKVVTRGNRTVKRILCTDARGDYPIIALVDCGSCDNSFSYTKDGGFYASGETSVNDLFFATEKHEGWVNIFKDSNGDAFLGKSRIFASKEEAEEYGKTCERYVATVKIEWEE